MATPTASQLITYMPNDIVWYITPECGVKEVQIRLVEADWMITPNGVSVAYHLRSQDNSGDHMTSQTIALIDTDPAQSPFNPTGTNDPEKADLYADVDSALIAYKADLT